LALRELVDRLTIERNSPTVMAVVQFGTQVQVVQMFTTNITEVKLKIGEMRQVKGLKKNIFEALQRTGELFKVQNSPHRKVVFVLTDGDSTKGDSRLEATKLRESVSKS
jgi:Mg-chelatase subunit ChlD